jgi:hypothetical protein
MIARARGRSWQSNAILVFILLEQLLDVAQLLQDSKARSIEAGWITFRVVALYSQIKTRGA